MLGSLQPYGPQISDHVALTAGLQPQQNLKVRIDIKALFCTNMSGRKAVILPVSSITTVCIE